MKVNMVSYLSFVSLLFFPGFATAKLSEMATTLLPNVVRVTSKISGYSESGFGFVIGEDDRHYYFVTANHVVRGPRPKDVASHIKVNFFRDSSKVYSADLLPMSGEKKDDIALFKIDKIFRGEDNPPLELFRWDVGGMNGRMLMGESVVSIGKKSKWYIGQTPGKIVKSNESLVIVDNLDVEKGSSGSPLIDENGIVGILIDHDLDKTKITRLEKVYQLAEKHGIPWGMKNRQNEIALNGEWCLQEKWLEDSRFGSAVSFEIEMIDLVRFMVSSKNRSIVGVGILEGNKVKAWWRTDRPVWESAEFVINDKSIKDRMQIHGIARDNEDDENYELLMTKREGRISKAFYCE